MAQSARKVNWFAIWVSAAVVVALALVSVLVVTLNNQAQNPTPGETPTSGNIEVNSGAILIGTGENRLDTYIDFMCPVCNEFEQIYGAEIQGLVEDGSITLGIHPISILDRASQGTEFSTRAAGAMYCVAATDGEASLPFLQAMFENQPDEGTTGLTNEQILQIASSVGVSGIDDCVNNGEYQAYVTDITTLTPVQPGSSGIGTPTIAVNGEVIANSAIPAAGQLATLFD